MPSNNLFTSLTLVYFLYALGIFVGSVYGRPRPRRGPRDEMGPPREMEQEIEGDMPPAHFHRGLPPPNMAGGLRRQFGGFGPYGDMEEFGIGDGGYGGYGGYGGPGGISGIGGLGDGGFGDLNDPIHGLGGPLGMDYAASSGGMMGGAGMMGGGIGEMTGSSMASPMGGFGGMNEFGGYGGNGMMDGMPMGGGNWGQGPIPEQGAVQAQPAAKPAKSSAAKGSTTSASAASSSSSRPSSSSNSEPDPTNIDDINKLIPGLPVNLNENSDGITDRLRDTMSLMGSTVVQHFRGMRDNLRDGWDNFRDIWD